MMENNGIKLRNAVKADARQIAAVLRECYNISSLEEGAEVFLSEMKKGISYIVAEENGKVIGLITWYIHGLPKHGLTELDRIAVSVEYRGKGISRLLFNALIEEVGKFYASKGCRFRKLYLLTHESNKRAHSFYEKIGLRHETTLRDHYYDGEDERVYSLFIDKKK